jgi:hypothetical protein
VLHEERHAPLAIVEVGEDGARQELLPHRLPEPLDLAARLRMVRPALHVGDAVATQFLLERRRAAPRRVLPPLVGEDLARRSIVGNAARQRLHHERALLVVRHDQAHHIARMVVHEGRHVHALLAPQQEREEVRLPQLVGLRPLETHRRGPRAGLAPRRFALRREALVLEHTSDRGLRSPKAEEALQHVAYTAAARVRLRLLDRDHRRTTRITALPAARLACLRPARQQRGLASRSILARPVADGRVWNAETARHFLRVKSLLDDHRGGGLHHVRRPMRPALARMRVRLARIGLAGLGTHCVHSFRGVCATLQEAKC